MIEVKEQGECSSLSASIDLRLHPNKHIEKEHHRKWFELLLGRMNF